MYQTILLPDSASASSTTLPIRKFLMALFISLTVISCVTINIYFPAAAAEKAAEKIVDDVLQSSGSTPGETETQELKVNEDQSLHPKKIDGSVTGYLLSAIIDMVIPAAHAGQADISIDSPKIRSIRNSMEKRQSKLKPFYASGAAGFTHDGYIAAVNSSGLSVKQQSTLKKLISAENNDRKALYREIAKANGHPEWQQDIQKTFAKTWISKISKGWMYQNPQGKWVKK